MTSLDAQPSVGVYPTKDDEGNLLETEFGLSIYKDHQSITIQELPEKAPPGQLPRAVDISCDDDLIDTCKPGDRIKAVGIYRCLPGKREGVTTATFRSILLSNNILEFNKEFSPNLISTDVALIRKFSENRPREIFATLARSIAPTIYGLDFVKKAVLCMLVGGTEKILPNGTRLRGDINILLIGDPSVAKSQILRYVWKTAPRAISTTGRGSSGVGLTASVVANEEAGGGFDSRRLEAGACVLADRGIVCIDEFDKMTDADRTAFHEVMEQGKVTVAKAGIRASLNARCSVLAAANPVYSRYDQYKTPMENIGMQDSLLSRFDLVFILLDQADAKQDQLLADHIVRVHQYRKPGERDGQILPLDLASNDYNELFLTTFHRDNEERLNVSLDPMDVSGTVEDADSSLIIESNGTGALLNEKSLLNTNLQDITNSSIGKKKQTRSTLSATTLSKSIYEKYDKLLHGAGTNYRKHKILRMGFLKKYIQIARDLNPQLTENATNYISEEYVKLRAQSSTMVDNIAQTQPITARTLETLIRLSTAHAKTRLSKTVDLVDAKAALELVHYAYFKKVETRPKKPKKSHGSTIGNTIDDEYASSDEYFSDTAEFISPENNNTLPPQKKLKTAGGIQQSDDLDTDMDQVDEQREHFTINTERLREFKRQLLKVFDSNLSATAEPILLNNVHVHINDDKPDSVKEFTKEEIDSALDEMAKVNQIMIDGQNIYRI